MPKRSRKQDFAQNALRVVEEATQASLKESEKSPATEPSARQISKIMSAMGRKGGKKGGKNRWQGMTPEERSQSASNAAKARWSKQKAKD